jgi:ABC-type sugar transport system permease subunit
MAAPLLAPGQSQRNARPTSGTAKPGRRRPPARGRRSDVLFLVPAAVFVLALLYLPFFYTVVLSLFDYNGIGAMTFTGVANYVEFLTSGEFAGVLRNTLLWVVGTLVLPVGLGLLAAVLTAGMRGGSLVRLVLLIPYGMSGAAIGVLWGFILEPNGALNQALSFLHLPGAHTSFLSHSPLSTILIIVAAAWQGIGVNVLLFTIGLQSIPQEPIEAARLDGANGWQLFRHVTWPLLRPITVVVVGLAIVNGLKTFDIIWVLTQGGPGLSSATFAVAMYQKTFGGQTYGLGAAIAVLLTVVATAASLLYVRRQISSPGEGD